MAFVRWLGNDDPHARLERMHRDMERLLATGPFVHGGALARSGVYPPLNVWDEGEVFVLRAEMPGVEPSDVDVSVQGDTVTIQGERKLPDPPEGGSWHRRERSAGRFRRSLTLPEQVDPSGVTASCRDGILEIRLPRHESSKQRRIEVTAG